MAVAGDHELAEHVAVYHAGSHGHCGLHLHLLMPFTHCPHDEDEEKEDTSPTRDPLSAYGVIEVARPSIPTADHWVAVSCGADLPYSCDAIGDPTHGPSPPGSARSFLGSLLAVAPLRAVTGVALC